MRSEHGVGASCPEVANGSIEQRRADLLLPMRWQDSDVVDATRAVRAQDSVNPSNDVSAILPGNNPDMVILLRVLSFPIWPQPPRYVESLDEDPHLRQHRPYL